MKYIFFFLLSAPLGATTLGQYYSSPDGTSVVKFNIADSKVTYEKRSNFFDKKPDFRLGEFEASVSRTTKENQTKLDALLKKIKTVDEFMKKKGESFNDLSLKKPHASFFMLEEFQISQGSDLYPEVKKIYEQLSALNWKQNKGIKLSKDFKKLIQMKDDKETSEEAFNMPFHCQRAEPPTICSFKDEGILYLK